MTIFQQLNDDLKTAMRAKDVVSRDVLRALITAVKNDAIAQKIDISEVSNEAILAVVKRAKKQREEAAKTYIQGERAELAEQELAEVKIVAQYLPVQMSEDEIAQIVQKIVDGGVTDMGAVMGAAMTEIAGRADGGVVRAIVQKLIA